MINMVTDDAVNERELERKACTEFSYFYCHYSSMDRISHIYS